MLLTGQEIKDLLIPFFIRQDQASIHWPDIFEEVALIEAAVIEKIKAQGGVVRRITTQDSMTGEITMNEEILYRLPEGD